MGQATISGIFPRATGLSGGGGQVTAINSLFNHPAQYLVIQIIFRYILE